MERSSLVNLPALLLSLLLTKISNILFVIFVVVAAAAVAAGFEFSCGAIEPRQKGNEDCGKERLLDRLSPLLAHDELEQQLGYRQISQRGCHRY